MSYLMRDMKKIAINKGNLLENQPIISWFLFCYVINNKIKIHFTNELDVIKRYKK